MKLRRLTSRCAFLALLVALPAGAAAADDAPYTEGQRIAIQGVVTDSQGRPLAGKTVELEVYRRAFSFNPRTLGHAKKGLERRATETGADGRYALEWPYFDYYNRYELTVGDFGAGGYEVAERVDLSRRILSGSPVVVNIVLGGRATGSGAPAPAIPPAAAAPRTTAPPTATPPSAAPPPSRTPAGAASAPATDSGAAESSAQQEIRRRQGAPDRIDTLELPYGVETTWWYFARGRAYRFLDGELSEEMTFDPVPAD